MNAIVPPSTLTSRPLPPDRLALWVRGTLAGLATGLVLVFAIACRLDPYDREGKALRMATHKQLGLPPCSFADITVFDEKRIIDRATYEEPFHYSEGIEYVIVNGQIVLDKGAHTGARPGRALRHESVAVAGIPCCAGREAHLTF